jgi:predicted O-methyltransferase YrrM
MRPAIENWTTDAEAAELARLGAGRIVLEVGTFKGFGAVLLARAGATVWAVDWHRGDTDLGPRDTLCSWWTNVRRHHVEDQVVGLVGRTEVVLPLLRPQSFELAFVDAAHDLVSVRRDIGLTLPLLRPGATIAFHDYCPTWPGVMRAVDELRARLVRAGHPMDSQEWAKVGSICSLVLV